MGRFNSVDALAELDLGGSPYSFAWNSPLAFGDPAGLYPAGPGSSNGEHYADADGEWEWDGNSWIGKNGSYSIYNMLDEVKAGPHDNEENHNTFEETHALNGVVLDEIKIDNDFSNWGMSDAWHLVGPTFVALGTPINALKPIGILGSRSGSSIASYYLSKVFTGTTNYSLKALSITKQGAFKITNTTLVGRFAGRWVPMVGWGLFYMNVALPMGEANGKYEQYNNKTGNWIANLPH